MDRMNRRALSMIAVSCLVGFLWTLPALAQSSTTVEKVGGAAEEIEKVSNEEKPEKSRRAIDKMRGALTKVIKYLEEAREQRDVLKLNCVNEKLTAIKGLLRVSEQADVAMQEAIATGELTAADHEYEKIMIASKKVQGLATESEVCIGELAVYSGQTSVSVEVGDEVISTHFYLGVDISILVVDLWLINCSICLAIISISILTLEFSINSPKVVMAKV